MERLVYVQWKNFSPIKDAQDQLRKTCRLHQTSFQYVDNKSSDNVLIYEMRDADYAVIWHGSSPLSTWAVETRKKLGKHYCILEVGWFPQKEYWHIDPQGLCGKSSLCDELPEPTERDWELLKRRREEYQSSFSPITFHESHLPVGYVLVPLQLEKDSTVYLDAPYRAMQAFVDHVLEKFPHDPIVFKTHPGSPSICVRTHDRKDVFVVREGLFTDFIPKASFVYGQTSTCLYESALIGKDVEAIGDCSLKHHAGHKEELLALMCGRQIERNTNSDMWWHITGGSIPPLKVENRQRTVSVITPSRDRPSIKLLEKCIRNQTTECYWIVSEDGMESDVNPDHHIVHEYGGSALESFRGNLIRGLEQAEKVDNEFFIVMEDDVWYAKNFLEVFLNKAIQENMEMVGPKRCLTYSMKYGWEMKERHSHSSLCTTLFHKSLIPHLINLVKRSENPCYDVAAWKSFGVSKKTFDYHLHLNIKDLPGTGGFFGHNGNNENCLRNYDYTADESYYVFKDILGKDALGYLNLV